MQNLMPALTNLPMFYTVTVSLLLMLLLAGISFYLNPHRYALPRRLLFASKLTISIPVLALGTAWTYVGAFGFGLAGLIGGSLVLLGLALSFIALYVITTWGLICWIQNKRFADVSVMIGIVMSISLVYAFQRVWLCEPLAHSGVGMAQLCTAQLYEAGQGGARTRRRETRDWYRKAADNGIAAAQYWVGMNTRDKDKRNHWLTRAADQGHVPAAYRLFLRLYPEDKQAVDWLQQAVDAHYPPALYRLGLLHRNGYYIAHDLERTRDLWHRSADSGYPTAIRALALAYARGVLFDIDLDASRAWEQEAIVASANENVKALPAGERHLAQAWQAQLVQHRKRAEAIAANDPAAIRQLSNEILSQAKDDPAQRLKGILLLEQGAAGDPDSLYRLASYYLSLDAPTENNTTKGLEWLSAAAESGHRKALRRMIAVHKEGQYGLDIDLYQAKRYSERLFAVLEAADIPRNNGSWWGPTWEYQDILKQIKRIERLPLPLDQLKAKADSGDPEAQYYLATDLEFYDRDHKKAQALLEASAHGGYPQAQYEMASRMSGRRGTHEEERQMIDWLMAAATSGHRGAMVGLGSTYLSGFARHKIDRNYYAAKIWLERAIEGKDDIVYQHQSSPTRGWQISVASVQRRLQDIPDSIMRLNLEGLKGEDRTAAITTWYEQERQALYANLELAIGDDLSDLNAALETLKSQHDVLLQSDRG